MKHYIRRIVAWAVIFSVLCSFVSAAPGVKYSNAGTFDLWTEESYYCAPSVIDLDGDGKKEIVFSNYTITVLDAETGTTKWKVNSGYDRNTPCQEFGLSNGNTWSDVEVHDINGDGSLEIISGHNGGIISVLSADGYFLPGWPQKPVECGVKSVEVADLDGDGKKEIVAGYGIQSNTSVYVFNCDGSIRHGWPQIQGQNGMTSWTYGIFMDNIAISDLNYDGIQEIIVPSDLSFVSVFEADGSPFKANSEVFGDRFWGQIALFEDYAAEIRGDNGGWGSSETYGKLREELYKGEFGHSKAVVADVDGNGSKEVIVPTIMCNRKYAPTYPPTEYMTVAILNADRTRYKNEALGFNWEVLPMDLGKPLVDNYQILCSHVYQRPTVCDIDGDGLKEILFNSYNGKVHCFSLNKKEPYAWPFSLTKRTSPEFEYASPVECKDINGDGKQEVIFSSFYDPTMGYGTIKGSLYVLNYEGRVIHKIPFPDTKEPGMYTNGSMAAPVVDDIDGDGAYEVVVNSLHGAICVFDL